MKRERITPKPELRSATVSALASVVVTLDRKWFLDCGIDPNKATETQIIELAKAYGRWEILDTWDFGAELDYIQPPSFIRIS